MSYYGFDNSYMLDTMAKWPEAFRRMAERGDDALLDADLASSSQWDEEEWEWK